MSKKANNESRLQVPLKASILAKIQKRAEKNARKTGREAAVILESVLGGREEGAV